MPTNTVNVSKSSDDIIDIIYLRQNALLELEEAKEGWELASQIDPTCDSGIFLKTAKNSLINKEARKFVKSEIKKWPCVAIQVHNLIQLIVGRMLLKPLINRNQINFFNNEKDAKIWLLTVKQEDALRS